MRPESVFQRFTKAWGVFRNNRDPTDINSFPPDRLVSISASPPNRPWINYETRSSIASPVFTRIAVDCANARIRHIKKDEQGRYIGDVDSYLNKCLTQSANDDQVPFALIEEAVFTMLDHGHCAIIIEASDDDPELSDAAAIYSLRVGVVTNWQNTHVRVRVYNQITNRQQELVLPKSTVAIVQNPFYSVMNDRNTTFERLKHNMALLDRSDDRMMDGKLDLIIQVPYMAKSTAMKERAEGRLKDITDQLRSSEYGVAYMDDTEKITQLNRPLENNLHDKVTKLRAEFFAEIGFTEKILDGSASEEEKVSYNNKIIRPILTVLTTEMSRKFLSLKARSNACRESIAYFIDPLGMATVGQLADLGDKYLRNEVLSPNEFRQYLGYQPSTNPDSDVLRNRNMPMADEGLLPYAYQQQNQGMMVDPNRVPVEEQMVYPEEYVEEGPLPEEVNQNG